MSMRLWLLFLSVWGLILFTSDPAASADDGALFTTNAKAIEAVPPKSSSSDSNPSAAEEAGDENAYCEACARNEMAETANPHASAGTRRLLACLEGVRGQPGKHIISGQVWAPESAIQLSNNVPLEIFKKTGKYPAFLEFSLGDSIGVGPAGDIESAEDMERVVKRAIEWSKAGGLVGVFVVTGNPATGGNARDTDFTNAEAEELVTDGGRISGVFKSELDRIAVALNDLQTAGVVVQFRIFPEMNGDWFWYGNHISPSAFIAIWRYTFDYLTNEKKLNNLIWVYAPGATPTTNSMPAVDVYYPGASYVDICGLDLYDSGVGGSATIQDYEKLRALKRYVGFTEFGSSGTVHRGEFDDRLVVDALKTRYRDFSFFKFWSGPWSMTWGSNGTALMNDPSVITRSDLTCSPTRANLNRHSWSRRGKKNPDAATPN